MTYRDELIQVAAVAVAAISNLDNGIALVLKNRTRQVLDEVFDERLNQDEKWGAQSHTPEKWITILVEEVGEVAKAALEDDF